MAQIKMNGCGMDLGKLQARRWKGKRRADDCLKARGAAAAVLRNNYSMCTVYYIILYCILLYLSICNGMTLYNDGKVDIGYIKENIALTYKQLTTLLSKLW